MKKVNSSNVDAIGYEDGVLSVLFLSGKMYHYLNVEEEHYLTILETESIGRYLNAHIYKNYNFIREESE